MPISRCRAGTGALCAVLLVFAGATMAAHAESATLAKFKQANAAVRAALSDAKTPPSLKNPAYAAQVSQAFDLAVVDENKNASFPDVVEICGEAQHTAVSYLLFGVKKEDASDPDPNHAGAQLAQRESANYLRFQDESLAAARFGASCTGLIAEKMDPVVAQLKPSDITPVRRAGQQQAQQGLVNLVSGGVRSILDPVRPNNRDVLLNALVQNVNPLTAAMSKPSRQTAAAAVDAVLSAPGVSRDEREKLMKVRQALNRTDCGPTCSFQ